MKIICMIPEILSVTEFFVIFPHFFPFNTPNNPENQNFEKTKKSLERYHYFTLMHHK